MGTTDLALIAGLGFVVLMITKNPVSDAIKDLVNLPPQEITSPQQTALFGLRSTNTLGFIDAAEGLTPLQTAFANLRDNLTFGGLLFQGTSLDIPIEERSTTSIISRREGEISRFGI